MTNDHVENPLNQMGEICTESAAPVATAQNKTGREREEKEESSTSTGSDGGKGNSSGSGGYNADCSSSDSSSNNDAIRRVAEKQKAKLSINSGVQISKCNDVGGTTVASKIRANPTTGNSSITNGVGIVAIPSSKTNGQSDDGERHSNVSSHDGKTNDFSDMIRRQHHFDFDSAAKELGSCLPQWNGITIEHPMDPRIDLSTVGFSIGSSHHAPFLTNNINIKDDSNTGSIKSDKTNGNAAPSHQVNGSYASNANDSSKIKEDIDSSAVPSPEQYTKLLECVRPFFSAHGITTQLNTTCTAGSEESQIVDKASSDSKIAVVDILNAAKNELAAAYVTAAIAPRDDDENNKDSSSMVVLARPKRKHSTKQEGTDSNSGRSASSSEEEARVQQQPQQPRIQQVVNHEVAINENENDGNDQALMEHPQQQQQQHQNILGDAQRYEFPTMVSEYSSSARNGSSGASNTNLMSTSGSGSGGNTASGTGSGSNQGGSSGSGNDQGGMSSNGNGSSGSGNDKGSSEEMMDHNMKSHSSENSKDNSGGSLPNNVKNKLDVQDNANAPRFSPNPSEPSTQRRLSSRSNDTQSQNAAREKKLHDKKRKRMNMRRVYEDQMEQDMGSSDSSSDQGVLRPGKPVTLDNAISFTKTAKFVVKSSPSLIVIYTNAAYSRLSGIDSHSAVGNPITSFLSLPSQQASQLDDQKEGLSANNSIVKANQAENFNAMNDQNHTTTDSKNHLPTEAAGRAQAGASCDDSIADDLEKLIVASGYGKLIKINVRCKPHKMLGRNVKVFKSMLPMKRSQEEGSKGGSIASSYDGTYNFVGCTMSISPVVSSPEIYMNTTMTSKEKKVEGHHNKMKRNEKEHDSHQQKSKRRKHHTMTEIMHNRKRQVISHYAIQLEPHQWDLTKSDAERGSHSSLSTDIEARMLGLTKAEVRQQRAIPSTVNAGNQNLKDEKKSEVSESRQEALTVL